MNNLAAAFSVTFITLACNGCGEIQKDEVLELCQDPRPQICTNEYNPVCATLSDGSVKTYATGCTACSDPLVKGWVPAGCE
ncbi:MAG: hypothetical protein ACC642_08920 [Pseudomonadales bacterium]